MPPLGSQEPLPPFPYRVLNIAFLLRPPRLLAWPHWCVTQHCIPQVPPVVYPLPSAPPAWDLSCLTWFLDMAVPCLFNGCVRRAAPALPYGWPHHHHLTFPHPPRGYCAQGPHLMLEEQADEQQNKRQVGGGRKEETTTNARWHLDAGRRLARRLLAPCRYANAGDGMPTRFASVCRGIPP